MWTHFWSDRTYLTKATVFPLGIGGFFVPSYNRSEVGKDGIFFRLCRGGVPC